MVWSSDKDRDSTSKYRTGKFVIHFLEFEALSHWFEFLTNSPDLELQVDLIIYLRTQPEQVHTKEQQSLVP